MMRSVLTWVAVLLIVLWLVGYIGFAEVVGSFIHAALALAFVAILARILTRRRSV
jgi:small-conductance mechanosensitive channel